jgi:hypothetical protein
MLYGAVGEPGKGLAVITPIKLGRLGKQAIKRQNKRTV